MIGRLQGVILEKQPPLILHTHLVVREDAQLLYGFHSLSERLMFRNLIKISGVGPKLALTILSGMSADDFTRCILEEDSKALTKLPGVGKKTAERLVIELKDRLEKDGAVELPGMPEGTTAKIERQVNPVNDAVSALISLGYKAQQASQMVRALDVEDKSTEEIIRAALQGGT